MALRLPPNVRNAAVDAVVDLVDAGSGPGTLKIYTGAQPASATSPATGTLLVTFTLADPAFESAASGSAAIDADPDITATAVADGTAGWGRVADSSGNVVFDGSAGLSGAQFVLNALAIVTGQTITLTSGTFSTPSGE